MPFTLAPKRKYDQPSAISHALAMAAEKIRFSSSLKVGYLSEYQGRIADFFADILKSPLTPQQILITQHIFEQPITNVKSGHNLGKSFFAAGLILYWVLAENGVVVTTAPNLRQVKEILWAEASRLHYENGLPGTFTKLRYDVSKYAYGTGFTSSSNNSSGAVGIHNKKLLAIEDEANGIDKEIDDGIQSMVSGGLNNFLLRITNPLQAYTAFFKNCRMNGCITLRCFEHPNVRWAYEQLPNNRWPTLKPHIYELIRNKKNPKEPILPLQKWPQDKIDDGTLKMPVIESAVSIPYIERLRQYGDNSREFLTRICGEFPVGAENTLFYEHIIRALFHEKVEDIPFDVLRFFGIKESFKNFHKRIKNFISAKVIGVDVGKSSDPHSISVWEDWINTELYSVQILGDDKDIRRLEKHIKKKFPKEEGWIIAIDCLGVGAKLAEDLEAYGYQVEPVSWGKKANEEKELEEQEDLVYANLKTEQVFKASYAMKAFRCITISIGNELDYNCDLEFTEEEFLIHTYVDENDTQRLRIIPKKNVKKIIGRSPNVFDSYIMGINAVTKYSDYESLQEMVASVYGVPYNSDEVKDVDVIELHQRENENDIIAA